MLELNGQIRSENPNPFPRRFLRLLSMGCGISKFDPKEVVEVSANSSKFTTSNCFTGESKSNLVEERPTNNHNNGCPSSSLDELPQKGDKEKTTIVTMKMNVKREGGEAKFEDDRRSDDDDENEKNGREICRGGSPSFREYCIDSDSVSNSFKSEDYCEDDRCKWPNQRTLNQEKEKGLESEMVKKERGGKGIMKVLQRGKSGGKKNFLSASRGQQNDCSQKLLPKPS